MKRLIQVENNAIVKQIPLTEDAYSIGRGADNDIVFDIPKVSRNHAMLVREGNTYTIVDKNSSNFVYVNGQRIQRRRLVSGDTVNLSREITLLFYSESDGDEKVANLLNRMWNSLNRQDFVRLKEVTSRIISLDSLNNILRVVLEEIVKLVGADRGFIALVDSDERILPDTSVTHNLPLTDENIQESIFSHSTVRRAIRDREMVFILGPEDNVDDLSNSIVELELQSIMCSPLLFGDKLVGILYVDSGYRFFDFNETDRFFFTILSDHAAIAIENAKLYSRVQMSIRQLREEVTASEERYRQLVEISPEAIVVQSQGKIVFANPASLELVRAVESSDLLSKSALEFIPPENRKAVRRRLCQPLEDGEQVSLREETCLRLDGETISIEVVASPLVYQGKPASLLIVHDITQRKRMEQELSRTHKLESVGVLAGGIAHDFNNILTAVWGKISLGKNLTKPGDKLYNILDGAEKATLRATGLTRQLLTFSKGGAPVKTTTSIKDLIRESAEFAVRGSNVRREFSIAEDLWQIEVDEAQIGQVINNLVINADQAMPHGGTIHVSAENTTLSSSRNIPLSQGKYVVIRVKDQGVGISDEDLPRIFDPYFTTKSDGTGLGIAISYSIVKNHDGYIAVKSNKGKGTTFSVYLSASTRQIPDHEKQEESRPLKGTEKILIMDDEADIREVVGEMMEFMGYKAEFARDGEEAIRLYEAARKKQEPFDAVIMDLTVPGGMGGKEAIGKLQDIDPHVKAIVASGYSSDPIMADYNKHGFQGVVSKPYGLEVLSKALRDVLDNS